MKECLLGGKLRLSSRTSQREAAHMLDAGLDLSRKRLNVCLLSHHAAVVEAFGTPPDTDGLRGLARRVAADGCRCAG
jgi:hypothetical protein